MCFHSRLQTIAMFITMQVNCITHEDPMRSCFLVIGLILLGFRMTKWPHQILPFLGHCPIVKQYLTTDRGCLYCTIYARCMFLIVCNSTVDGWTATVNSRSYSGTCWNLALCPSFVLFNSHKHLSIFCIMKPLKKGLTSSVSKATMRNK